MVIGFFKTACLLTGASLTEILAKSRWLKNQDFPDANFAIAKLTIRTNGNV